MFSKDSEQVRDRIRDYRKLRKATQQDLADFIGMKRGAFRSREADGNFEWEHIELIAEFFDVSPYFLQYGAEEEDLRMLAKILKSKGRLCQPEYAIFGDLSKQIEINDMYLSFLSLRKEDQKRIERFIETNNY